MKMPFSADKFVSWPTTHHVWGLGLARGCDVIPSGDIFTTDSTKYVKPDKLNEGDIIFVHTQEMKMFFYCIFPRIRTHFILVLGDSDATFPGGVLNKGELDALLRSERLIHLFAQNSNYNGNHPKFSNNPIGLDFHTLFLRAHGFHETYQSIEDQELTLNSIIAKFRPTNERRCGALCDFHLSPRPEGSGDRINLAKKLAHLQDQFLWFQPGRIPRREIWKAKGEYAFSISPHGNGLDCIRTWEDLVLGCIVIVKTSKLDPLYDGLPVVIVQDWDEITPQNFEKWHQHYGDAFTNPEYRKRLTHEYWMNRILAKKNDFLSNNKK